MYRHPSCRCLTSRYASGRGTARLKLKDSNRSEFVINDTFLNSATSKREMMSLPIVDTDEDLVSIRQVLSGQRDAYAHLVRKYQARVLRLCTALLREASVAEDAAQDIFLKAYQSLHAFQGHSLFSTWLYRIAANRCKDLLRKRSRQRSESWEALVETHGEALQQLLTVSANPTLAVADADLADRLLSQLPPDYRLILTLREVEGLSYQELAETLACSMDAVKARLRRARQALQDTLRHFCDPERV